MRRTKVRMQGWKPRKAVIRRKVRIQGWKTTLSISIWATEHSMPPLKGAWPTDYTLPIGLPGLLYHVTILEVQANTGPGL